MVRTRHLHRFTPLRQKGVPTPYKPLTLSKAIVRSTSTSQAPSLSSSPLFTRSKALFLSTSIGLLVWCGYLYVTDVRAGIHQWAVAPSLRWIYDDAEEAHEVGTESLKALYAWGLHPRERGNQDQQGDLSVEIFGHTLSNPIGTSAGIDKHAAIPDPLFAIGPSIIEIGGCTPNPQNGNPKPRVFRLPSQKALINRYGLNSEGVDHVAMRLRQRVREYAYAMGFGIDETAEQRVLDGGAGVPPGSLTNGKLMMVNVAKNKSTPDDDMEAVKADYVYCVNAVARYADIIVVNVSSPNTPGLRGLQRVEPLTKILTGVVEAVQKTERKTKPAVMVKVSPDEDSEDQVRGICDAVWKSGVDGVVVGNTTKRRHDLLPADYSLPAREAAVLLEEGGFSGPQLFERTVALTWRYRTLLDEGIERKQEPEPQSEEQPSRTNAPDDHLNARLEETTARDAVNLKPDTPEAEASSKNQPLIRLPARNNPLSSDNSPSTSETPALSASHHVDQIPSKPQQPLPKPKVIFATGGITNGKQALEVLAAGANVAQVYTALVYGGVGTVHRLKVQMRDEMKRLTQQSRS